MRLIGAPPIADAEIDRRSLAFCEQIFELRLMVASEHGDRPNVAAERPKLPSCFLEVFHRNACIVLDDRSTAAEQEVADG
jgi:hypothetical protein